MNVIFLALFLGFWQPYTMVQPITLLQGFMLDLSSQQLPNLVLEEKYFCSSLLQQHANGDTKMRVMADSYLTLLKKQLSEQQVNTAEIQFIPFNQLPNKEFELIGNSQQVYAAQYRGDILCYFLLKEDKIESFLLLNQAGRAYFVSFCE